MLARLEELVARPGAPNLYWALTALPRPLVGLRDADGDRAAAGRDTSSPSSTDLDRPRTEAEWSSLLTSGSSTGSTRLSEVVSTRRHRRRHSPRWRSLDAAGFKARYLAEAKRALEGRPARPGR